MTLIQISVEQFSSMISNMGFPIVAFYLMYRMATQTIADNIGAIQELSLQLEGMGKN